MHILIACLFPSIFLLSPKIENPQPKTNPNPAERRLGRGLPEHELHGERGARGGVLQRDPNR